MSFVVVLFIQVEILWQSPGIGLPPLTASCFVSGNPPRPGPIQDLTITSEVIPVESLDERSGINREIAVGVNFNWTASNPPFGNLLRYNIWLSSEALNDPNEDREFDRALVGV